MSNITLDELAQWNQRIETIAREEGLDFFDTEFELCSHEEMLGYEAYLGMPSHYPHWSYGKAFDRMHTLYRYNLSGLPYEMVINSNPCLAYLMRDNSLLLQILTMAHVYGHNDFFKNNRLFQGTRPELVRETFKNHANRIRGYIQDPTIGYAGVERILDAAHALRYQCNRSPGSKPLSREEQKQRLMEAYENRLSRETDPAERRKIEPPNLTRIPLEPEPDLLKFILEYSELSEWEKDVIQIVRSETAYFVPQIETKILNEGWASYWHYRILNRLELPPDMQWEFLKYHHQVIRPIPGGMNPYHLGFTILMDVERRYGREKLYEVRSLEADRSLIRRYLTRELCQELHLFEYLAEDERAVVTEIADEKGWEKIRHTLSLTVGMGSIPVIEVVDMVKKDKSLILRHEYDGRELELNSTGETLKYLVELWGGPVVLHTYMNGSEKKILCDESKRITIGDAGVI
ncbi:MAG TPA: SpoVR family protein [Bacillota bacterium]|nr:SpoVR family protein [Bacillota bacterium]HPT87701.1 SpoVR family protein [Bacillota bacterium]